jgi:hypothetical protein
VSLDGVYVHYGKWWRVCLIGVDTPETKHPRKPVSTSAKRRPGKCTTDSQGQHATEAQVFAYVFLEDGALLNGAKFDERFSAMRMARDYVAIYERLTNDRSLFEKSLDNGYHLNAGIRYNGNMIDLQKKPRTTVSYVPALPGALVVVLANEGVSTNLDSEFLPGSGCRSRQAEDLLF